MNGVNNRTGMSIIFLAIKYGSTEYILLACSLKKTGLSYWKTMIALNIFPMN
jgi:hypothetical protein